MSPTNPSNFYYTPREYLLDLDTSSEPPPYRTDSPLNLIKEKMKNIPITEAEENRTLKVHSASGFKKTKKITQQKLRKARSDLEGKIRLKKYRQKRFERLLTRNNQFAKFYSKKTSSSLTSSSNLPTNWIDEWEAEINRPVTPPPPKIKTRSRRELCELNSKKPVRTKPWYSLGWSELNPEDIQKIDNAVLLSRNKK